jgi:hypothetical protein
MLSTVLAEETKVIGVGRLKVSMILSPSMAASLHWNGS